MADVRQKLGRQTLLATTSVALALLSFVPATAQEANVSPKEIATGDIVVTAQKRSERLNTVPMSINAVSGAMLRDQGIRDTADLVKIVPGLTYVQSGFATPVYSIRGVGFYETSLASTPAVTVYTDEIPLAYPQMTRNAGLDVERVEVLKGPQGTLFGQNATGGAINYIATKPTSNLQIGSDLSFGRFATVDASAFVSGPINDNVRVRFAARSLQGDDWQRSYTQGRKNGKKNIIQGRLLVDVDLSPAWNVMFGASGWIDHSESQAPQLVAATPAVPLLADPSFLAYPTAPASNRAADWSPSYSQRADDGFYQLSMRNAIELSDDVTLTAITAYSKLSINAPVDVDGTALELYHRRAIGNISSFYQEVRSNGTVGKARWIIGAGYQRDTSAEDDFVNAGDGVVSRLFGPAFSASRFDFLANGRISSWGLFGNLDLPLSSTLTLQGGARYSKIVNRFEGCTADYPDNDPRNIGPAFAALLNQTRDQFGLAPITIPEGGCITFDDTLTPGMVQRELRENNISWRVALNWQPSSSALLYANVSKGYKAGNFASVGATLASQYDPAGQEGLLAYEAGFKLSLVDRKAQLNGAIFYYDYNNKQLRGSVQDPIFGSLDKLLNIPKSYVLGWEVQTQLRPVPGFTLNAGLTWLKSKVNGSFNNYTPYGQPANFDGESFPYTPKWQGAIDAQYEMALSSRLSGFIGANARYQDTTRTAFGKQPIFFIPAYTIVDLRAGVASNSNRWRAWVWGRNIFNQFTYTSLAYLPTDSTVRYAESPATYGVSLSFRY